MGRNNANNANKNVIIKNCASFTDCISKINNAQADNSKDIVMVLPVYNLIEYSNHYSKTWGSLCQYYRDEPALNAASTTIAFPNADNNSVSFKFQQKITG